MAGVPGRGRAEQPLSDYQTMFFANGRSNSPIQEAPLQPSLRQNWAQLALRGLPDFLHVVSQDDRIRYVSKSCETVVGHESAQLIGQVVHNFIHPEDLEVFTMELAHLVRCGVPTRFIYRFQAPDHRWIILESQCNIYLDQSCVSDHCDVIIMARPYSTKTNFMVDSYLEHKIAYETLTRQKAHLENESDDEDSATESEVDESDTGAVDGVFVSYFQPQRFRCQSSSTKPQVQVEIAYFKSQGQVDNSNSSSQAQPTSDRSEMIGDLGIPFSLKRQAATAQKKKAKKSKKKDYLCMMCSATESPEWRKGPRGPRTLCNSCGLRWAKNERSVGPHTAIVQNYVASKG